ncbi:hypothetical protein CSUI_002715 [Cystoisospora suis]|uniref:Uncharacterized protein n=1 Tax=Cystoisospora suis TaxID=483139 RepID=A0A2C6L856_9APIC|nr:hypothetical protein CSUI_002715 [Cystoisospora suis]
MIEICRKPTLGEEEEKRKMKESEGKEKKRKEAGNECFNDGTPFHSVQVGEVYVQLNNTRSTPGLKKNGLFFVFSPLCRLLLRKLIFLRIGKVK